MHGRAGRPGVGRNSMLFALGDKVPRVAESAWIGPGSFVIGDVVIGEHSTVWPGAVIRADFNYIRIGENVHVEDNVVLHGGSGLTLGNNITIGHSAVVHCKTVGDFVLLANNCTVLDDAVIGEGSIIAAGALVAPREVIPPYSMVMGIPGIAVPIDPAQLEARRTRFASAPSGAPSNYFENAMRYRAAGIEEREFWPGTRAR
jgi:carbonic anhydrase/acetyltransferase-like protein (isoleucine patch superfamily)